MRIFGGKLRSTVRALNQSDSVTVEDWRSLQLDILVCFPSFRFTHTYVLVTDVETLQKHDSVHTIEDALAHISHEQTVQLDPSGFGETSQQVLVEALPLVLVLHLKRFLYDKATNGTVKISKSVQFSPELEIPPGAIFSFVSLVLARRQTDKYFLAWYRNHFQEI
jgi:ubiquitin carboxyl-terminal hydrolase 10